MGPATAPCVSELCVDNPRHPHSQHQPTPGTAALPRQRGRARVGVSQTVIVPGADHARGGWGQADGGGGVVGGRGAMAGYTSDGRACAVLRAAERALLCGTIQPHANGVPVVVAVQDPLHRALLCDDTQAGAEAAPVVCARPAHGRRGARSSGGGGVQGGRRGNRRRISQQRGAGGGGGGHCCGAGIERALGLCQRAHGALALFPNPHPYLHTFTLALALALALALTPTPAVLRCSRRRISRVRLTRLAPPPRSGCAAYLLWLYLLWSKAPSPCCRLPRCTTYCDYTYCGYTYYGAGRRATPSERLCAINHPHPRPVCRVHALGLARDRPDRGRRPARGGGGQARGQRAQDLRHGGRHPRHLHVHRGLDRRATQPRLHAGASAGHRKHVPLQLTPAIPALSAPAAARLSLHRLQNKRTHRVLTQTGVLSAPRH
eukprot:scaffold120779_cov75-Phaeocystis_antarctica.AAC.1